MERNETMEAKLGLPPKIPGMLMKPGYLIQDRRRQVPATWPGFHRSSSSSMNLAHHLPSTSSTTWIGKPNNAMPINELQNLVASSNTSSAPTKAQFSPSEGKTPMLENLMPTPLIKTTTSVLEPSNHNVSADVKQEVIGNSSEINVESKSPSGKEVEMDPNMDPKRIKRILANRLSAQRSRIKKMQYIAELEQKASSLQAKIGLLTPQVGYYDNQRLVLTMENNAMKQRISSLMHEQLFKDAQYQVLRRDGERLKQLYLQQQQQQEEQQQQQRHEQQQQQQQQQQQEPITGFSETNQPQSFNVTADPLSFFFD